MWWELLVFTPTCGVITLHYKPTTNPSSHCSKRTSQFHSKQPIASWKLASYEYSIEWRASGQHSNADALSRLPLPQKPADTTIPAELVLLVENMNDAPVTAEQVASLTRRDPLMAKVYRYIQEGWPKGMDDPALKPYWT